MTQQYPNARNNPAGAIPVYLAPGNPKAMPIKTVAGASGPNFGAIPVRVVAGPGTGGSDQGKDSAAIPVVESTSPKAMPVWDAAPTPLPPVVNEVTFSRPFASTNPPLVLGTCTCVNGPATWAIIDPAGLSIQIATGSGQLLLLNLNGASVGSFSVIVQASNADGTGTGTITIEFT